MQVSVVGFVSLSAPSPSADPGWPASLDSPARTVAPSLSAPPLNALSPVQSYLRWTKQEKRSRFHGETSSRDIHCDLLVNAADKKKTYFSVFQTLPCAKQTPPRVAAAPPRSVSPGSWGSQSRSGSSTGTAAWPLAPMKALHLGLLQVLQWNICILKIFTSNFQKTTQRLQIPSRVC